MKKGEMRERLARLEAQIEEQARQIRVLEGQSHSLSSQVHKLYCSAIESHAQLFRILERLLRGLVPPLRRGSDETSSHSPHGAEGDELE